MALLVRIIIATLALLTLFLFLYKSRAGAKIIKIALAFLVLFLVALIAVYEFSSTNKSRSDIKLLNAFNDGKMLLCGDENISAQNYEYVAGTRVFRAKERHFIISIDKCNLN